MALAVTYETENRNSVSICCHVTTRADYLQKKNQQNGKTHRVSQVWRDDTEAMYLRMAHYVDRDLRYLKIEYYIQFFCACFFIRLYTVICIVRVKVSRIVECCRF